MKKITVTTSYLQGCLKQARYYEFCKDSDRALKVLEPIWENIEEPPDIVGLEGNLACEILVVCGSIISSYGTTNQIKHCQELAADMLTRAREIAIVIGERDLIAESEKQLAIAYWRHGQLDNAVAFLNTVLNKYSGSEQIVNPVCLHAQANLLMLYVQTGQQELAFKTFRKIKPFVDETDDLWLKTGFYNQAAGIYVFVGDYKTAIPLLEKDIEYAKLSKNNSYLGNALNNLANAYVKLLDLDNAKKYIDQATELFQSINQIYPYSIALETKAQILAQAGDYQKALLLINESIQILEKGENYAELCESIWTKIEILIKTQDKKQVIRQFNRLLSIADANLDSVTTDRYIEQFEKKFYLPVGKDFEEKEINFRQFLLAEALEICGGAVTKTANYLGIKHQTLSFILKKFPALCLKHQVKLRKRSTDSLLPKNKEIPQESFVVTLQSDRLAHLGLPKGSIIKVVRCPIDELDLSKPVAIQDANDKYHCGMMTYAFDMLALDDGHGSIERTFVLSEIMATGQVISIYASQKGAFIPLEDM